MKISVLSDNHAGAFTMAEHGLSYLIEHKGSKVLLDAGQSDLFLRNAVKMSVCLDDIGTLVLSHGHFDHGNGLEYLNGGKLICHPGSFVKRYGKTHASYIGLKYTRKELSGKFDLYETSNPKKISEDIWFLGEIPRLTDFESRNTTFTFEDGTPDFVKDDSAVAMVLEEGIFIATGCGHAGIVNTIEHARKVTGERRVFGIIGGFHLKAVDRQTTETIEYLKEIGVKYIMPSHCTELPALAVFYNEFGIRQVKTGDVFEF